MGETTYSKQKKNKSRVLVKDRPLNPSIQRTYKKPKEENTSQQKLI